MRNYDFARAGEFFSDKMMFTTGSHELELLVKSNARPTSYQVVDVRYAPDYEAGHVPGAVSLPRGKWRNVSGLDKEATLYVYCYNQTCHLGAEAAVELVKQGYRVVEVEGGWDTWVKNGYPIEGLRKSA